MTVVPFPERLRQLADERHLSVERVLNAAWNPDVRGTSPSFAKKVISGERSASTALLESIARALEVEPSVFIEWELAMARDRLDSDVVGLDEAAANLSRVQDALFGASSGDSAEGLDTLGGAFDGLR